jgi:hypothetical protein
LAPWHLGTLAWHLGAHSSSKDKARQIVATVQLEEKYEVMTVLVINLLASTLLKRFGI